MLKHKRKEECDVPNVKTWVTVCSVLVFSRISRGRGGGGGGSGGCIAFSMSLLLDETSMSLTNAIPDLFLNEGTFHKTYESVIL